MKTLLVTAGYSIFDAKGQLNSYLAYLTEKQFVAIGHEVKISNVTKDSWSVDREVEKLLWAENIVYIMPVMWFNMPSPMVKWLAEVLLYKKTFIITDEYGEGGLLPANRFMIVATSNMKSSDLGKGYVLKHAEHIDDLLQPLIMTNNYLGIRDQIPTFHAGDVIAGDTGWIESAYEKHIDIHFNQE